MNCDQIINDEITEKYLLGELSEGDQQTFERHYFECPRCFRELETYRTLQLELKRSAPAIRAKPAGMRIGWILAWAPAAAVVVLVAGVSIWLREKGPATPSAQAPVQQAPAMQRPVQHPAAPSLSDLAQIQPPPYAPITLRGAEDEAQRRFREAMRHYVKAEYRTAISGLRQAFELNPKAAEIRFFLGVCYLLVGETEPAINHLRATIALGDSPYLEEAHFYLAKAYLKKSDVDAASEQLRKVIGLQGERRKEAESLMEQIQLVEKRHP
jgi:tetratricopeptide (TPR) repeat protein